MVGFICGWLDGYKGRRRLVGKWIDLWMDRLKNRFIYGWLDG